MGYRLEVACGRCGDRSEQVDGAVMSGFNPRCDRCGRTRLVSIAALVASDPSGTSPASAEAWTQRRDVRVMPVDRCDAARSRSGRLSRPALERCANLLEYCLGTAGSTVGDLESAPVAQADRATAS